MLRRFREAAPADAAARKRHEPVRAKAEPERHIDGRHRHSVLHVEREHLVFEHEHAVSLAAEAPRAEREKELLLTELDAAAVERS